MYMQHFLRINKKSQGKKKLSYIHTCTSQRSSDAGIILTKNKVKAVKKMVFRISCEAMKIRNLPNPLIGSQVDLALVLTWIIRNLRLHKLDSEEMEVNISLDGRPFWGMYSVHVFISSFLYHIQIIINFTRKGNIQ